MTEIRCGVCGADYVGDVKETRCNTHVHVAKIDSIYGGIYIMDVTRPVLTENVAGALGIIESVIRGNVFVANVRPRKRGEEKLEYKV